MILTVDRSDAFSGRVTSALRAGGWSGDVRHVVSVDDLLEILRSPVSVEAVVIGPSLSLDQATFCADSASRLRPSCVVLIVAEPSTDVLRAAMRAGARDVLAPDFADEDMVAALREAGLGDTGPAALPGLTVAVFSTKGGVGTSVVASNLAVRLGERTKQRTTLLDLDLASADQSIIHGLTPKWTIQDFADGAVGRDRESFEQALKPIEGTNARVLPGPFDPALAERITGADVSGVIAFARSEAPYVVLDTASAFDDRTLAAFDAADVIVVVSSLDVPSLRALSVSLATLAQLGVDAADIRVVMSRADSRTGLQISDVERSISRSVDVRIPSTRAVPRSVNEGVPLAVSASRSAVVSAIDDLVDSLLRGREAVDLDDEDDEDEGGSLFGRRRRGSRRPTTPVVPSEPSAPSSRSATAQQSPGTTVSHPSTSPGPAAPRTDSDGGTGSGRAPSASAAPAEVQTEQPPTNGTPSSAVAATSAVVLPPPAESVAEPVAARGAVTDQLEEDVEDGPEHDAGIATTEPDVIEQPATPSLDDLPPPVVPSLDDDTPQSRRRGRR